MSTATAETCLCGQLIQTGFLNGKHVRICLQCGEQSAVPTTMKLPGLDRGRQEVQTTEAEKDLVKRIKRILQSRGYIAEAVGQKNARLGGNDAGVADILIGIEGLTLRETCEVKLPGWTQSDCTAEQWALYERGSLNIIASVEEALTVAGRLRGIKEALAREAVGEEPVR